jgi:hypothetical protein
MDEKSKYAVAVVAFSIEGNKMCKKEREKKNLLVMIDWKSK